MLYLVGLGLNGEKSLTLEGGDALKKCDIVYLENYTSIFHGDVADLNKLIGKDVKLANRTLMENMVSGIIDDAKDKNIGICILGDVLSATTHISILQEAKEKNIPVKVIHNTSILNAISNTGLSLYNFGKTTSIPFTQKASTPCDVIKGNGKLHTLVLLDIDPKNKKTMTYVEGLNKLLDVDSNILTDRFIVTCAGIGTDKEEIHFGKVNDLLSKGVDVYPQCFVVVGDMHFVEEEYLVKFKV